MKKQLIPVLVALTLLPTASFAERYVESYSDRQNEPGAYFSGFIGTSIARDTDAFTTDYYYSETYDRKISFDPSLNLGIAGGYDFGPARMEAELSYKHADMEGIKNISGDDTATYRNPDGSLGAFSFMCNLFFDIPTNSPVTPYVGGGVGFSTVYISDTHATSMSGSTPTKAHLYDESDDTVLAYQFGAGVEVALNRKLSLDLAYRYFGTDSATFDFDTVSDTGIKFRSHNATIGLRVKF